VQKIAEVLTINLTIKLKDCANFFSHLRRRSGQTQLHISVKTSRHEEVHS